MALHVQQHGGRAAAAASSRATPRARALVIARSRVLHGEHGHGDHHVPWYAKHKEMWTELADREQFAAALAALGPRKLLVVDYYAPWCAVCKTAYPSMCRMADSAELQADFVFAKASLEQPEVKEWVKAEGIKGIPHLSVYGRSAAKLLGMGASFKKADAIRHNLRAIAANRDAVLAHAAGAGQLSLDPNSFVVLPEGAKQPAKVAK